MSRLETPTAEAQDAPPATPGPTLGDLLQLAASEVAEDDAARSTDLMRLIRHTEQAMRWAFDLVVMSRTPNSVPDQQRVIAIHLHLHAHQKRACEIIQERPAVLPALAEAWPSEPVIMPGPEAGRNSFWAAFHFAERVLHGTHAAWIRGLATSGTAEAAQRESSWMEDPRVRLPRNLKQRPTSSPCFAHAAQGVLATLREDVVPPEDYWSRPREPRDAGEAWWRQFREHCNTMMMRARTTRTNTTERVEVASGPRLTTIQIAAVICCDDKTVRTYAKTAGAERFLRSVDKGRAYTAGDTRRIIEAFANGKTAKFADNARIWLEKNPPHAVR